MAQTSYVTQVQLDWDGDDVGGDDSGGDDGAGDDDDVGDYAVHGNKEEVGGYKDDNE